MSEPLPHYATHRTKPFTAVLPTTEGHRYYRINSSGGADRCDTFLKLLALEVGVSNVEAGQALDIMRHLAELRTAVIQAEGQANQGNGSQTKAAEAATEARCRMREAQEALAGFVFKFKEM